MANVAPLVSVYITTKNRLELVRRAIDSVLAQTYPYIEIFVCDDGSDIDVTKVLGLEYPTVKFARNSTSLGACAARNLCIDSATGEFITGLDDDDYFLPGRIQKFVENWDGRYSFLCTNVWNKKVGSRLSWPLYYGLDKVFPLKSLLLRNEATSQVFTLRSRLLAIDGFDPRVKKLQDWDTWIRLCHKFGDFHRFIFPTYVMMDDSRISRVSYAQSYADALGALLERNGSIYDDHSRQFIYNQMAMLSGEYDIKRCLHDSFYGRSFRYFFKYLRGKF